MNNAANIWARRGGGICRAGRAPLRRPAWRAHLPFPALLAVLLHLAVCAGAQSPEAKPEPAAPAAARPAAPRSALPREASRPKDALLFHNGDILYGLLKLIDPGQGLRWQHPDAAEPIDFDLQSVSEVRIGPRPEPSFSATNLCRVRLTNQDELAGSLVSCDTNRVVLETWYAGRLEIPRTTVQFIIPQPAPRPAIFEGPIGLEDWNLGKVTGGVANAGYWSYKNGAFYATKSASIARDLKLPDVASFQFDLAWKGMFHIAIALYTDYLEPVNLQTKEAGPDFGGFYSLQLNSYTANLLPVTKNDPIRYLGQTSVSAFSHRNKAHVEVRISKPKRMIALLVDGVLVKQWIDTEAFVGQGTGVRFVHQGQGAVKMSNLRVAEWDGQFEEKPSPQPNGKLDVARLQNGDRASGDLQRVEDGKLTFSVAEGPVLEIPLDRVRLIEFAGVKSVRPPEDGAMVRAFFRDGGMVTFRLVKWDENAVVCASPFFGEAIFKPAAFERVLFHAPPPGQPQASAAANLPFRTPRLVRR